MKSITIDKLSIRNFKGCGSLELTFGGKNAAIYGDNATGKTTIYDALTWLLFGKDSLGQSNDENIKPLDATGAVKDHEAVTAVEAVLTVEDQTTGNRQQATGDGAPEIAADPSEARTPKASLGNDNGEKTLTLRKELRELWTARRGSSQLIYGGNTVDYSVDGVPIQKKGYTARIGELVDEETFRLLTSVSAFASDLHWQKRRAILAEMSGAGDLSEKALLQQAVREESRQADEDPDPRAAAEAGERAGRFGALLDDMEGRTMEDEKKILQRMQKDLKQAKTQTPARIDELMIQETKLALLDFDGEELRRNGAQEDLRNAQKELARLDALAGESNPTAVRFPSAKAADGSAEEVFAAEIGLRKLEAEAAVYEAAWHTERSEIEKRELALASENNTWRGRQMEAAADLKRKLIDLEEENREYHRDQLAQGPDLNRLQRTVDGLKDQIQHFLDTAREAEAEAQKWDYLVEQNRQDWLETNKAVFDGGTCPTCGQELPMEMLAQAKARFEDEKARKLKDIEARAEINTSNAKRARKQAEDARKKAELTKPTLEKALEDLAWQKEHTQVIRDLPDYRERKNQLQFDLTSITGKLTMPGYEERAAEIKQAFADHDAKKEMPGYAQKKADLRKTLGEEMAAAAREADEKALRRKEIEAKRREVQAHIGEQEAIVEDAGRILSQKMILEYTRKRIVELREDQKKAAAELERVEALLYAIEDFIRWKTRFVEDSVNGLFRMVKFRLFRDQANGGVAECCDAVVDGVPYAALNNGARINAGLDIIRRLGEFYGVRVPLFVDNAESVTRLEDAGTQVIRLVVSEQDKRLRVEI